MNKVKFRVEKIWSYQTLIYKNGRRTFPKPIYEFYKAEMAHGMAGLRKLNPKVPIKIKLILSTTGGLNPAEYRVKVITSGNTARKFDNLEEAEAYKKDHHEIEVTPASFNYGALPDFDNAVKPIVDCLQEIGVIANDNAIVDLRVIRTYGNEFESIEVEIEEYLVDE